MSSPNLEISSSVGHPNLRLGPEEYAKTLRDWTPYNDCFPRSIRIGDVDGMVEIGSHFLFLEAKPPGKMPTRGQQYAFERLVNLSDRITYVVLNGIPPTGVSELTIVRRVRGRVIWRTYSGAHVNLAFAKRFVRRWAIMAARPN